MKDNRRYIRAIVPLRLEWEPLYRLPDGATAEIGTRIRVKVSGKDYDAVVSELDPELDAPESKIREIEGFNPSLPAIFPSEIRLWREVARYYLCSVGEVFKAAYPSEKVREEEALARKKERLRTRLSALRDKLEKARTEATRERYSGQIRQTEEALRGLDAGAVTDRPIDLSPAQELALADIRKGFREGKTVLLDGVTGSGKTELYMKLARETVASGKSVLYLVPEIALSRQLEERVAGFFPGVLVFHSGETASRRRDTAAAIREQEKYIVLGTRSSIFLPHRNLGLVIVDEEHDTSYKQDSPAPRYNGRDTAIMLAGALGARVLLGSATPSLESIYNVRTGRYAGAVLPQRYWGGGGTPTMIIDTLAERRKGGMDGHISRKLYLEMEKTLAGGGQIVLLRARRSWAPAVQCTSCGKPARCPSCGVPLSLHKDRGEETLRCHHCGYHESWSGICNLCGGELIPIGAGSQRIEDEVRALFPSARVGRLDADVPTKEGEQTVKAFASGDLDILVGTQMVSKGFDFAGVSLVAVLQADSVLAIPDFRSDEKGLQLLEQFKGRTGRRGKPGLFIIQTAQADHPVITGGRAVENLLAERRLFGYPPFTREVDIAVHDTDPGRLQKLAAALSEDIAAIGQGLKAVGPYQPSEWLVHGETVLLVRAMLPKDRNLVSSKDSIAARVRSFEKQFRYWGHITLNVDPL